MVRARRPGAAARESALEVERELAERKPAPAPAPAPTLAPPTVEAEAALRRERVRLESARDGAAGSGGASGGGGATLLSPFLPSGGGRYRGWE